MNDEQIIMQIIINGGNARSKALMAVRSARKKQIDIADALLKEAKEALGVAHKVQTELIQAETRGDKTEISLLLIHAQDHLMNAMTVIDLATEMVEEKREREE